MNIQICTKEFMIYNGESWETAMSVMYILTEHWIDYTVHHTDDGIIISVVENVDRKEWSDIVRSALKEYIESFEEDEEEE